MSAIGVPLRFKPLMVERVWGANRLGKIFGKELPAGKIIGESWELCDRPEAQTTVWGGAYDGWTLRRLMVERAEALLGEELAARKLTRFPLLLKFIDAAQELSVQVHPDDAGAAALGYNESGKTECWVVVHAEKGAKIQRGLLPGVTRKQFEAALNAGRVLEVLHFFEARPGAVVAVPAGMVHALGGGVTLAEIQQNSDITFRLFDYNRLGLDGKPRALHPEESMSSIRFDGDFGDAFKGDMRSDQALAVASTAGGLQKEDLLFGKYFNLTRYTLASNTQARILNGAPHALMILQGAGKVSGVAIKAGDTLLLPADLNAGAYENIGRDPLVWVSSCPH